MQEGVNDRKMLNRETGEVLVKVNTPYLPTIPGTLQRLLLCL